MAVLKFEIDTDEIWSGDYDGEGAVSFEDLVRQAVGKEVRVKMQSQFSGEAFDRVSNNIALECIYQVERKLRNLINEDIVMQDRWGDPKFVGTVEDYIKQQIDKKLLRPVNSNGQTLSGCSVNSDNDTWVEFTVQKTVKKEMERSLSRVEKKVNAYCKKTLNDTLEEFKNNTLNGIIMDRLNAVGIGQ